MHYDTLKQVRRFRDRYLLYVDIRYIEILEVGSRDAGNGSIRNEFQDCSYTGADLWRWLRNRNVPHISTVAVGLME